MSTMSTTANMPIQGMATAPRLTKRALNALKKGAMVELWIECEPFTIQIGDVSKVEKQVILCSIHTALIKHFSRRWNRELAGNTNKRVSIPFARETARLVVDWMMSGGGNRLGKPEYFYPKNDLRKLEILKKLATYLEIDSLVGLLAKDIVAAKRVPPPLPAAKMVPKTDAAIPKELCWYCNKPGHFKRDCLERTATFVTVSTAGTFSMDGTPLKTEPNSPRKLMSEQGVATNATSPTAKGNDPKKSNVEPVARGGLATNATSQTAKKSRRSKEKLWPVSGKFVARDATGTRHVFYWDMMEIELMGPVMDGRVKITGTATEARR